MMASSPLNDVTFRGEFRETFFCGTSSMGVIYRVKVPNGGWQAPTASQGQGGQREVQSEGTRRQKHCLRYTPFRLLTWKRKGVFCPLLFDILENKKELMNSAVIIMDVTSIHCLDKGK